MSACGGDDRPAAPQPAPDRPAPLAELPDRIDAAPAAPERDAPLRDTTSLIEVWRARDVDGWKHTFDERADDRQEAGVALHWLAVRGDTIVCRIVGTDDAGLADLAAAEARAGALAAAGDAKRVDQWLVRDRGAVDLPEPGDGAVDTVVAVYEVDDVDAWQAAFDAAADWPGLGVVATLVAQDRADPRRAVVQFAARDGAALADALQTRAVRSAMKNAGVRRRPKVVAAATIELSAYRPTYRR